MLSLVRTSGGGMCSSTSSWGTTTTVSPTLLTTALIATTLRGLSALLLTRGCGFLFVYLEQPSCHCDYIVPTAPTLLFLFAYGLRLSCPLPLAPRLLPLLRLSYDPPSLKSRISCDRKASRYFAPQFFKPGLSLLSLWGGGEGGGKKFWRGRGRGVRKSEEKSHPPRGNPPSLARV